MPLTRARPSIDAWRFRRRVLSAAAALAVVLVACAQARAQGDDHDAAAALCAQLEHDVAHKSAIADALARAKAALERAIRLRAVGDERHARLADGLAREWAETARDVARAVDAEAHAVELRTHAMATQERLGQTHALVEEGIARVGRLGALIAQAEKTDKDTRTAVESHDAPKKPKGRPADPAHPAPNAATSNEATP
jgi:hypothetical protein